MLMAVIDDGEEAFKPTTTTSRAGGAAFVLGPPNSFGSSVLRVFLTSLKQKFLLLCETTTYSQLPLGVDTRW